ncbi:MAG: hypothetical protein ONB44_15895 [candidate division KSB1 bacterium]|nr:hypothetical protein [candidate division KSB1 bacterium]MDZ7303615.1 hypothetical protein [candidate division KSB1 bacterium]MDZ7312852.1 hypothetical protein [candidate division KSB1 bacterium]
MKKSTIHKPWGKVKLNWKTGTLLAAILIAVAIHIFHPHPNNLQVLVCVCLTVSLNKLSAAELFKRCAVTPSDEAAWEEFFHRYQEDIRVAMYRKLGFPPKGHHCHLFADAMQKFNLRLIENDRRALRSFRGKSDEEARAFLRTVATSVAANSIRDEKPPALSLEEPVASTDLVRGELIPDASADNEDSLLLRATIDDHLQKLFHGKKNFRNILVFKLAIYEKLSPEEIAKMPGLNLRSGHAVEQRITRIRRKLQPYFTELKNFSNKT